MRCSVYRGLAGRPGAWRPAPGSALSRLPAGLWQQMIDKVGSSGKEGCRPRRGGRRASEHPVDPEDRGRGIDRPHAGPRPDEGRHGHG